MADDQRRSGTAPAHSGKEHRVTVLGSFTLTSDGAAVPLGVDSRRLVAYLAVHPRPQERAALAADLWPGVPLPAALRMLADAEAGAPDLLAAEAAGDGAAADDAAATVVLAADVQIDLADALGLVRAMPDIPATDPADVALLGADILPGWTAAWLAIERERFRQLRLHALEERSQVLSAAGRHTDAVEMARRAVHSAPSRESARRALIQAYLAQGDIGAAMAEHDDYQELLRSSVGGPASTDLDLLIPPSPVWPVLRARQPMPRSAVQLPGLRSARGVTGSYRRLVGGGSARP